MLPQIRTDRTSTKFKAFKERREAEDEVSTISPYRSWEQHKSRIILTSFNHEGFLKKPNDLFVRQKGNVTFTTNPFASFVKLTHVLFFSLQS